MAASSWAIALAQGVGGGGSSDSGVAMYGSLDAGVARVGALRTGRVYRLDGGTTQPDRLGFRGSEDLGGGLRASFLLESGFSVDTGAATSNTAFFNRNSSLSLAGPLGALTVGHLPTLMYDWVGKTSNGFQLGNLYAFHPGNFDTLSNNFQFDNAIRYNSPEWQGLTAGAVCGLGESKSSSTAFGRNLSAGANYLLGPLRLAAAYSIENNRTLKNFDAFAKASGLPAGGAMDQVRNAGIGMVYKWPQTGLNAVVSQTEMRAGSVSARMLNVDVGLSRNLSPADVINLGVSRSSLGASRWTTLSMMNLYSLSKRTQLYLQTTVQRASGEQAAVLNAVGVSASNRLNVLSAGLHQSF